MPQDTKHSPSIEDNCDSETTQGSKCQPRISRLSNKLTELLSKDQQVRQDCHLRLVSRNGRINVYTANVANKHRLYLADPFTTLLDSKWRWIFLTFAAGFLCSWMLYGSLWWLIIWLRSHYGAAKCVDNVDSWVAAFLFSVETQTTIGYGGRQVTPECPEGVLCLLVQSLTGVMLSASLLGLVFAKLSRPRPRAQTLRFSKCAIVSLRDGQLCLMFRVGDIRKSQLLEVTIKLHCFQFISGDNGSIFANQSELPITFSPGCEPDYEVRPFFLTPLIVTHVIDDQSPLYALSGKDLSRANLELVAVLEGVVESTGMVTQARASYIPSEIYWGQAFYPLMLKQAENPERVQIDFSLFDRTYATSTPICSARDLEKPRKQPLDEQRTHDKDSSEQKADSVVWLPRKDTVQEA